MPGHFFSRIAVAGAVLLLAACGAGDAPAPAPAPAEFTVPGLEAAFARVRGPVEEAAGLRFESAPEFVIVDDEEIAATLARELVADRKWMGDAATGPGAIEAMNAQAERLSTMLFALLDTETGRILVNPATFRRIADISDDYAGVLTRNFLDVIVAHESVHALQLANYGLHDFVEGAGSEEELQARTCVVEGHAQYVTRAAAGELGLTGSFETLVRVNTNIPDEVTDEARRLVLRILVAQVGFPYVQGEVFVRRVTEIVGEPEAAARLFREPPTTLRAISHPEEYVAGTAPTTDLEPAVARIREALEGRGYVVQTVVITEQTLRVALEPAPAEARDRALSRFTTGQVVVGVPAGRHIDDVNLAVAIMAMDDDAAGEEMLGVERVVSTAKDKAFAEPGGFVQIVTAEYADLAADTVLGFRSEKLLRITGAGDRTVNLVVGRRGRFVVEVLGNGLDEPIDALTDLCRTALDAAR